MRHYDDDARLTLGEFCEWAEQTPAYVRECEEKGIIARDENGLFELRPTINAMADHSEAELAWWKANYRLTWYGLFRQLALWPEYLAKRSLLAVLRLILRLKRMLML
jgi:hypothetical protein